MSRACTAAIVLMLAACRPADALAPAPAAAVTPAPTPTVTAPPAATPAPTATATSAPAPTSTPAPRVRQLTTGGCCAQPFWSADGTQVRFIDRPSADAPAGIWAVPAAEGQAPGAPSFVTDRLGVYSADESLVAYPENGQTYIERAADGKRWIVPSGGRAISFSPDGTQIAWQVNSSATNFDRRVTTVWVANVDGSQARQVARLTGGGLSGWFPDGRSMLVSGREGSDADPTLAALDLASGALTTIAQAPRLRGGTLSPQGGWVAYTVTFSGDPARDGLWVVRTDGSAARRLDVFGTYAWRAEGRLLVIPLDASAAVQRLVEVDAATGETRALTDPAVTPLRIASGYWALSPDGSRLAFVAQDDHDIWVLELP